MQNPFIRNWVIPIEQDPLFFSCSVYVVGSTPGRYVGSDMERWGHLRLRKVTSMADFIQSEDVLKS